MLVKLIGLSPYNWEVKKEFLFNLHFAKCVTQITYDDNAFQRNVCKITDKDGTDYYVEDTIDSLMALYNGDSE